MHEVYTLKLEFLSYWRSGTGRGEGVFIDATTRRDALELPMLPGRQIKGLIRHALQTGAQWNHWNQECVDFLCGRSSDQGPIDQPELDRFSSTQGLLKVSSGRLSEEWQSYFKALSSVERKRQANHFFHTHRQTKIDATGLAQDQSLRSIQVVIPLTLESTLRIDYPSDESSFHFDQGITALTKAVGLIRSAGGQTSRGLGRVQCHCLRMRRTNESMFIF